MATTQQNETLTSLFDKYNQDLLNYNSALSANAQGHSNLDRGIYIFPYSGQATDRGSLENWLSGSDAGVITYKSTMDASKKAYMTFKDLLDTQATQQFAVDNPALYADVLKNEQNALASKGAEELKIKAQAEADAVAQKNQQYLLIGGIVLVVIIVGTFIYLKFINKNKTS